MQKSNIKTYFSPLVIFIFIIGILISFLSFEILSKNIEKNNKQEFRHILQREASLIQREVDYNLYILNSLRDFYNSSNFISRDEFRTFVEDSLSKQKSIQALEWIPLVSKQMRQKYELQGQKDLNREFDIKQLVSGKMIESTIKDRYFPVYYLEPLIGNEKALGFDLSSSSTRLKSILESERTRKRTVTSKITLIQEKEKQFGFLVFVPVWEKNNNKQLKGFVLGVYRVTDIINKAFYYNKNNISKLDLSLYDITEKKDFLFTNVTANRIISEENYIDINLEQRTWRLYGQPSLEFIKTHKSYFHIFIFIFGFLLTTLTSYIVALKVMRTQNLERIVKEKTTKIRETNKKYEVLLDMFEHRVIASRTDLKGCITYATVALCSVTKYSYEELIGSNQNIVNHPDMPKSIFTDLWNTIQQGKRFTAEIKNKKKDGSSYWVDTTIIPEFDNHNKIISYFSIGEDITAKKEVENFNITLNEKIDEAVKQNHKKDQLLLQQSKLAAMGEMIGAIAHQWRQPLNILAMQVQYIEDDFEDEIIDGEYLSKYSKESMDLINFMSKTIDDFRNFFTIDKMKINLSIRDKILETTNILSAQLESKKIALHVDENNFIATGYSSEFQQVILNIINNAKDAFLERNIENTVINISIEVVQNIGYIKISDNAGGIPPEVIDRIFEPYFTTKEEGKGTGLGLYMSKMIIEDNMGGKISVKNIDNGSQFTIELGVINE